MAPHHWLLTLNDYVTSSLSTWRLHSQSFVPFAQATGWSLWLYRTPTCRFLFITIRVVIFASWWEKGRTSSGSSASVSQPRTKSSWGLWLPFPPSSTSMDDWLILASSELVTSISRRGDSVFAFFGSTSSRRVSNLLRLLEEFLSTSSPPASLWHRILGFKDHWNFLDDQIQVSWFPLCWEFLLWWTRVVQLREGVSFSLPVPDVSFLSDASDVGCGPS